MKIKIFYIILSIFILIIFTISLSYKLYKQDSQNIEINFLKSDRIVNLYNIGPEFFTNDIIKNNKITIINIFASWCVSCKLEHDLLMELKMQDNIDIYGIAFRDYYKNTAKFIEKYQNPYKYIFNDKNSTLTKKININSVPETLIIDNNFNIIFHHKGVLNKNNYNEIINIYNSIFTN